MERELELVNQGLEKLSNFTALAFAALVIVFLILIVVVGYLIFRRLNVTEKRLNEEREKALRSSTDEQQMFTSQLIGLVGKTYESAFDRTVDKLTVVFQNIAASIGVSLAETKDVLEALTVLDDRRNTMLENSFRSFQEHLQAEIRLGDKRYLEALITHDKDAGGRYDTIGVKLDNVITKVENLGATLIEFARQREISQETMLNQLTLGVKSIQRVEEDLKDILSKIRSGGDGGTVIESPLSPPATQGEEIAN